jgi:hypothetical protein
MVEALYLVRGQKEDYGPRDLLVHFVIHHTTIFPLSTQFKLCGHHHRNKIFTVLPSSVTYWVELPQ